MSRSSSDITTRSEKYHTLLFQVPGRLYHKVDSAKSLSNHIDIKVAELVVAAHSLLVNIVEVLVAESTEEGGVVGDPDVVLAHPDGNAGLADVAVAGHLRSHRPQKRVVLLALRVARAHQSDVNKGEQVLVVALVLKQTFWKVGFITRS